MNYYRKYILPKFLNLIMKRQSFKQHRRNVIEKAKGVVLEVGFGSGLNLPYYKDLIKLYALEPSEELWKIAQPELNNVSFDIEYLQNSAESIPLNDSSIDYVISTWTLCSIPDVSTALREIKRVLKPGGKFLFIDHGQSPKPFISSTQRLLTPISKRLSGGCHLNREIEKLIKESGLEIEKMEKFTTKTKPLIFMYKGVAKKVL